MAAFIPESNLTKELYTECNDAPAFLQMRFKQLGGSIPYGGNVVGEGARKERVGNLSSSV